MGIFMLFCLMALRLSVLPIVGRAAIRQGFTL